MSESLRDDNSTPVTLHVESGSELALSIDSMSESQNTELRVSSKSSVLSNPSKLTEEDTSTELPTNDVGTDVGNGVSDGCGVGNGEGGDVGNDVGV